MAVSFISVRSYADTVDQPGNPAENQNIETITTDTPKNEPVTKKPSLYALPWQLRSVMAANLVRMDSALAFYDNAAGNSGGFVAANVLTGAYKIVPNLAVLMRLGIVTNDPPAGAPSATSFVNPLVGGLYSLPLSENVRMGLFLGMTVPIGMGGGNAPDAKVQAANAAGLLARSAMDNALFSVNYISVIPGVGIAYVAHGVTAQAEATILQYRRVRGSSVDKDSYRTNFTSGFELGYSFCQYFFLEGELRYQRWLKNDTVSAASNPAKQNLSFAVGPRFNFKKGTLTFKPGIAYAQGLAGPIAKSGYTSPTNSDKIVFIDVPIFF